LVQVLRILSSQFQINLFITSVFEGLRAKGFASVSSSTGNENVSTGTGTGTLPPMPPPSSYIGSPVFWIGVGVALSVAFTTVSSMVKVSTQLFLFSMSSNGMYPHQLHSYF